jgi:two-component sensor histidine kinase
MGTPFRTQGVRQEGTHVSDVVVAVLPPRAASASEAREIVTTQCVAWGMASLCDDVALVVTELVANAVRHAGTDIQISVSALGDGVRLEVRDGSTRPLRPRAALSSDEGGRGLLLDDALSSRYGVQGDADGKRVWVELRVRSA